MLYTSPSNRRKGYAGALVSELSKILYKENRMLMLYTDLSNPVSNNIYKNIGFVECGIVDQVSFQV
ncbi:GNAT family N-acetyltransferase [Tissierella praeacuta]|uniref:GNAT family N-acetyltransferase n=1 Tax=Tissierella praeacuta TaxID=43131 RepID=UPI0033414418